MDKEEIASENPKGLSLRKMNYIMSTITIVIAVLIFVSTSLTSTRYKEVRENTSNYIAWEQTAEQLQVASDYLTEQVRAFAVTGDRRYLDSYFEEATVTQRRDATLLKLEKNLVGTPAYNDLVEAMRLSVELMQREYYAMRLTVEANGYDIAEYPEEVRNVVLSEADASLSSDQMSELANEMVYDDVYREYKDNISRNTHKSIADLAIATEEKMGKSFETLSRILAIQQALIVVVVIVLLGVIILTSMQVISPLIKAVPHIKEEKPLPIHGAYEYKFLAKTYNKMFESNRRQKKLLAYEATHDLLTGVYNRGGFEKTVNGIDTSNCAMIIFDVDNFKSINDTYGHEMGDRALLAVVSEIRRAFRSNDLISRMGGDEFIATLEGMSDTPECRSIISDKIAKINNSLSNPTNDLPRLSVSAGVAFGSAELDIEKLRLNADHALYSAKNNGKNGCAFYD